MSASFGIDLGTTNSSIAWLVAGVPRAIPVDGHPLVPSVVLYRDGEVIVGREARNLELRYPGETIRSVKRRMGEGHRFDVAGRAISPPEVSAEILGALRRGAEAATGLPVRDVVITVPAYFDDAQRRATLQAGELAGLNVLRLLNEPTSASLVYDQARAAPSPDPELVMIYDLGGGTFDVSILEVFEGVREVRATTGNTHLGGDDFDELLVRRFTDELRVRGGVDAAADARARARLRRLGEAAKIALSADIETRVQEEFLLTDDRGAPVHLDLTVTRRELEELIRPLLDSSIDLCRRALADARVEPHQLARICLVGGSTRIPLCRALLAEAFGADIHEEIDPDLAVALGAAMQGGLLSGAPLDRILVDVATHSLGIRAIGSDDLEGRTGGDKPDTFAPVLRRNTVLPAQRTEELYTCNDDEDYIEVDVFQGEAPRVSQNTAVGAFRFPLRPVPAGSPVRFDFAYDLNGVVRVSVSQPGTDNVKTVALTVADAGRGAQNAAAPVERKANALLERLAGPARAELERLLARYRLATDAARPEAEEALLDFFIDHEDEAGEEG
ncbi:MAG TPA: Hsp70 family protein [Polyangia bacterium]